MILLESLVAEGFKGLRRLELRFPSDGAVLVEGLNEAGKSTLFESVYFALYGSLLVSESSRGGPEEAIGYGRDGCSVTLAVSIGGTRLEVSRTIRHGRASQAALVVLAPGRERELVQGVRAVNARIVEELGNLDGDALLNSCFVEQKKLSKLEDLTADRRRESLLRLLNLDRLGEMESTLRPTRADDQELARAKRRAELANLLAETPLLRDHVAVVDRELLALATRAELVALAEQEATAAQARASRNRAEARAAEVEALRGRAALLHAEREASRLEKQLASGESGLHAAERRLASAREASRRFQLSDALAQWVRLHRSVALREHGERDLREAEADVALRAAEHQAATAAAGQRRATAVAVSALGLATLVLAGVGISVEMPTLAVAGIISAVALGILAWQQFQAERTAATAGLVAESSLTDARVRAQTLRGQRVAAINLLGGVEELSRCESTLAVLGEAVPADEEGARARHSEVERRLVLLDRVTVANAERAAERTVETLKRERDPLATRASLLRAGRVPIGPDALESLAVEVARAERSLELEPGDSDEQRVAALSSAVAVAHAEVGQQRERERNAEARREQLGASVREGLGTLAGPAGAWDGELSLRAAQAVCPLVATAEDLDGAAVAARRNQLLGELIAAERQVARLAGELGLDGTSLDPAECRAEVDRLERLAEVKRRAVEIVGEARKRMVARVLPNTERNFRMLLPLLTAGRYRDARIADDYRVEVWDAAAGRYVAKSIFSGGARDQFSLALRLAFALATLPEELGTSPGFLFLDEPLSSFDGPRTQALVDLLTRGEVAASFRQIFVISHSRSFDASAFRYRLVLADGAVVESNLPPLGVS